MGCFSFLCPVCGKSIKSSSEKGEECVLYLLKDGVVIEMMAGQYDSYGRVLPMKDGPVIEWKMDWDEICNTLLFNDERNGICAIHRECLPSNFVVTKRSKDDPEQGWGEFTPPPGKYPNYAEHFVIEPLKKEVVSGKPKNKYDVLIEYVEWVTEQHYANGLSKSMIIKKAHECLDLINGIDNEK